MLSFLFLCCNLCFKWMINEILLLFLINVFFILCMIFLMKLETFAIGSLFSGSGVAAVTKWEGWAEVRLSVCDARWWPLGFSLLVLSLSFCSKWRCHFYNRIYSLRRGFHWTLIILTSSDFGSLHFHKITCLLPEGGGQDAHSTQFLLTFITVRVGGRIDGVSWNRLRAGDTTPKYSRTSFDP